MAEVRLIQQKAMKEAELRRHHGHHHHHHRPGGAAAVDILDSDSEEDEYDYVMPWYRPEWFDRLHPVYQELLLALVRVVLPVKPFRGAFSQIGSREWGAQTRRETLSTSD